MCLKILDLCWHISANGRYRPGNFANRRNRANSFLIDSKKDDVGTGQRVEPVVCATITRSSDLSVPAANPSVDIAEG